MKKNYLIDAATSLAVACSDDAPVLTEASAQCGDDLYLCYSKNNAFVLQADEVEDFQQHKFRVVGQSLIVDPAWIEPVIASVSLSLDDYRNAIQRHLDAKARAKNYDDIKSAALRAGYPGPFHSEGVRYAQWMDACWAKGYEVLSEVEHYTRPAPTLEQLINELPEFV